MLNNSYKLWVAPIALLILAVLIEPHFYLDWDVTWLVRESQQFIHGGRYVKDFFDPNPPMILYLYSPAALILSFSKLSLITVVRVYTFLIAGLSLLLCWTSIKRLLLDSQKLIAGMLLAGIAFSLFLLPIQEFAQREHFLLILVLPYLFTLCLLREKKQLPSVGVRVLIGVLAGIGFCIKPYFLIIPLLLEIYMLFGSGRQKRVWRYENSMILMVLVGYIASIYFYTPEYYRVVLPFVYHFYVGYASGGQSLLLFNAYTGIYFMALLCAAYSLRQLPNKSLAFVFLIAGLGGGICFVVETQPWYYHVIPLFGFSVILLSILLANFIKKIWSSKAISASHYALLLVAVVAMIFSLKLTALKTTEFATLPTNNNYFPTQLIREVRTHPGVKSLFSFSTHPGASVTVSLYAHIKNCSRFTGFWMMPDISKQNSAQRSTHKASVRLLRANAYVRQTVAEDFARCKPDMVIVDTSQQKRYFSVPFNYLSYFLKDPSFKSSWRQYSLSNKIEGFSIYLRGRGTAHAK